MITEKDLASSSETNELEELTSDGQGSGLEVERASGDDSVSALTFDPSKIDVTTLAQPVYLLIERLRHGELDLTPDFQRRANLWDARRKSSLIESMLLRIPIPSLYVSEDQGGSYTVVDGLQRICAIAHFLDVSLLNKSVKANLSPLHLTGLQSLTDCEFQTSANLPRNLLRRLYETQLTLHVIRANTPEYVKFNIFSRINQGGLPLTAQEIRNAVYRGGWQSKIHAMAESDAFLQATEGKIKAERMEDMELVLRFVAHFTFNAKRDESQDMDKFLNETVEKRSTKWNERHWTEIESAFLHALNAATRVFGRHAFRKYFGPDQHRRPINRGLFEAETVLLARCGADEIAVLSTRSEQVLDLLAQELKSDRAFSDALLYATGRGSSSNTRLEVLGRIFQKVLRG